MNASRSPVVRAEPNVTPMIDIMLVLLIIFMIVVPVLDTAIPPEAANLTAHPEAPEDRTLAIDRAGRYYLNKRAIQTDSLPAALRALFAARPEDHVLYLKAHRDLEYGKVRDVLTVAGAVGIRVVGMVSEKTARPTAEVQR